MSLLHRSRKALTALMLVLVLSITAACTNVADRPTDTSIANTGPGYEQLERGNTGTGQDFGNWVVQTGRGLIKDAYVRDNDKLGVVITPQVKPNEVRTLAKSLVQGFRRNFPNHDLSVLMYAPDKQLILTAQYNNQSKQIQYQ
ncbi:MAG TPA: hypothetical protein V6D03_11905 [Candidatus Caenarcaniphilales bacterium]